MSAEAKKLWDEIQKHFATKQNYIVVEFGWCEGNKILWFEWWQDLLKELGVKFETSHK